MTSTAHVQRASQTSHTSNDNSAGWRQSLAWQAASGSPLEAMIANIDPGLEAHFVIDGKAVDKLPPTIRIGARLDIIVRGEGRTLRQTIRVGSAGKPLQLETAKGTIELTSYALQGRQAITARFYPSKVRIAAQRPTSTLSATPVDPQEGPIQSGKSIRVALRYVGPNDHIYTKIVSIPVGREWSGEFALGGPGQAIRVDLSRPDRAGIQHLSYRLVRHGQSRPVI